MFDNANRNKHTTDFAKLVTQLDGPTFLGVAKMLKVQLFYDDVKDDKGNPMPRSAEAIIEDTLVKFHACNRAERRHLLKMVCAAIKEK